MGKLVTLVVDANVQKEQVFEYVSAVISGIPELNAQYAGLRIHADMRLQMYGDHARVKLENARFKTFNKDREGMTMRQMAESGDKIERASSYPTESVAIVYEPEMC